MTCYKENYIGKAVCYCILLFLFGSITTSIAQAPFACPIYTAAEPTVREIERSPLQWTSSSNSANANWSGPIFNTRFSDDQVIEVSLDPNQKSQTLDFNDFDFRFSEGTQIHGIQISLEGKSTGAGEVSEITTTLLQGGQETINMANYPLYGTNWPKDVDQSWTFASSSYLWGTAWSMQDILSPDFGIRMQIENKSEATVVASIDKILIRVFYTPMIAICDHDCIPFFVHELDEDVVYQWEFPNGFEILSDSQSNPNTTNIKVYDAEAGVYEICVRTISDQGTSDLCCRPFIVDDCRPSTIGDYVWIDSNGNGVQDDNEQGFANVGVSLYSSEGELIDQVTTNNSGFYQFTDIIKGDYTIKLSQPNEAFFPTIPNLGNDALDSDLLLINGELSSGSFYVESGVNIQNLDFGFAAFGTISGKVWEDLNANGSRSFSDMGIPNVPVQLIDLNGEIIASTTSDTDGNYFFQDILPSTYILSFNNSNSFIPTLSNVGNDALDSDIDASGKTTTIDLAATQNITNIDAGYYQYASVGDFVFIDLNRNNVQDADDQALSAQSILLLDANFEFLASIVSDNDGSYGFDNLVPGLYYLILESDLNTFQATIPNQGDDTVDSETTLLFDGRLGTLGFSLISNEDNADIDLGVQYIPASICGLTWEDMNADGLLDSGDTPLSNTQVSLSDESGTIILSSETDQNGQYCFEDLNPGNYRVIFENITDLEFTFQDQGDDSIDSDANSNGETDILTITPGQDLQNVSAGYYGTVNIGDATFIDINRDGIQNDNAGGIPNLVLFLYDAQDNLIAQTTTDSEGKYLFESLVPGEYNVRTMPIDDFLLSPTDAGFQDHLDSDFFLNANGNYKSVSVILPSRKNTLDLDLGLVYDPASISGLVWEDLNANGIQETNEPSLSGITVSLLNQDNESLASLETDAQGAYSFDPLNPGTYFILITGPDGLNFTLQNIGDNDTDSDVNDLGLSNSLTIVPGQQLQNINGGLYGFASIGDHVFIDLNRNGIQDNEDDVFTNLVLSLFDSNNDLIGQTTTDNQGNYTFENLIPTSYYVVVNNQDDFLLSLQNQGFDDNLDSDFSLNAENDYQSEEITLFSQDNDTSIDLGLVYVPASISGFAWEDLGADGTLNATDPLFHNLEVSLLSNNVTILTTMTDQEGQYSFQNLNPGTYQVQFSNPENLQFSPQDVGDDTTDSDVNPDGITADISIAPGDNITNINAGYYGFTSLGDYAFIDINRNGIQDVSDLPFGQLTLILKTVNGDFVGQVMSNDSGFYTFENVIPGTYFIEVANQDGFLLALKDEGSNDNIDSDFSLNNDGNFQSPFINLISRQEIQNIDIGQVYDPSSISGLAWEDLNANGIQEVGEPLLTDIFVTLLFEDNTLASGTTDQNGFYLFENLNPGDYQISFGNPEDLTFSPMGIGDDATDSDVDMFGITSAINLSVGIDITNINAGYFGLASIGDYAFIDVNKNGIQDDGDLPFGGLEVSLYNTNDQLISSTTTDSEGLFLFDQLVPGGYYLSVERDDDFLATITNDNDDPSLDSDLIDSGAEELSTSTVVIISKEINRTTDLGFIYNPGQISGNLWEDLNADGILDNSEPSLSFVSLSLFNEQGTLIESTTSDESGNYTFDNLNPDNYYIQVSINDIFNATITGFDSKITNDFGPNTSSLVTIAIGQEVNDIDAGFYRFASLGDFIWNDLNNNGIQDSGEPGLADISVQIFDNEDNPIGMSTTDQNGIYSIIDVVPGTYYLQISHPEQFSPTNPLQGANQAQDSNLEILDNITAQTTNFTLVSGAQDLTIDGGLVDITSKICGQFFLDDNANGIQNLQDQLIDGIIVNLHDADGTILNTIAATAGNYCFEDLLPGEYFISIQQQEDLILTIPNVGNDDTLDSDFTIDGGEIVSMVFNLNPMTSLNDVDAGFFKYASIGDFVWNDLNNNGIQDISEPGIPDLEIQLFDSNNTVVNTATSGTQGQYSFNNITPGEYSVAISYPEDLGITLALQGSDNSIDSDIISTDNNVGRTDIFVLTSDQNNQTIDLGLVNITSKICGQFFLDDNANGIQNLQDQPIDGIIVNLHDVDGTILNTIAATAGNYCFEDLLPGEYYISIQQQEDLILTIPNVGNDDTVDSDFTIDGGEIVSMVFNLNPMTSLNDVDAGFFKYASIGDFVWNDLNNNGIQDIGEPGIPNIELELFDANNLLVVTTTTDEQGIYFLENITPGSYYLQISYSDNFNVTATNQGTNPDMDNDFSSSSLGMATTDIFNLFSEQHNHTIDAGLVDITSSICGRAFEDINGNGLQDAGEPSISATAKLHLEDGTEVASVETMDGNYCFEDVMPGTYYVSINGPNGFQITQANAGIDESVDSDFEDVMGIFRTENILVSPMSGITNIDAGFYMPVSVGDFVWEDLNQNGIQDIGEPGISGLEVSIINPLDVIVGTTITDEMGMYMFANLVPGFYRINFEQISGFGFSPAFQGNNPSLDSDVIITSDGVGSTDFILLSSGSNSFNIDAGITSLATSSIQGNIWEDLNANGVKESEDLGLEGYLVELFDSNDLLIASTNSNIQGNYSFTEILSGDYYIKVNAQNLSFTDPNVPGIETLDSDIIDLIAGTSAVISVGLNENVNNVDAGLFGSVCLGGMVWMDQNMDGLFDLAESGINGIKVSLINQNGSIISETFTVVNSEMLEGKYQFSDLRPGMYQLRFDVSEDIGFTTANAGNDDTIDSDIEVMMPMIGFTNQTIYTSRQSSKNIDAGLISQANGSISGLVWEDLDGNGNRLSQESLIENISIELYNDQNALISTTQSDENGMYIFSGLAAGTYYIKALLPADATSTTANAGNDEATDSDITDANGPQTSDIITLASNQQVDQVDVGLSYFGKISGFAWNDDNGNGIFDNNEQKLNQVTVNLIASNNAIVDSQSTDDTGNYCFSMLNIGTYRVQFELADNQEFTLPNEGNDESVDSDVVNMSLGTTESILITSGAVINGVNAGYRDMQAEMNISGITWEDINGDGVRQNDEPTLSAIMVTLFDQNDIQISSTMTATDGTYSFMAVPMGNYYVQFGSPSDHLFTLANQGSNETKDSDVTEAFSVGSTDLISNTTSNLDAGYYRSVCIGDLVWNDFNSNGIFDNTEEGLNNIIVALFSSEGEELAFTFTENHPETGEPGYYMFCDFIPGQYYVKFETSGSMQFSDPDQGNDDTLDSDVNSSNGFGSTSVFTILSGETNNTIDAGMLLDPADIGDRVWLDENGNGIQDDGEPGINGVTVELYTMDGQLIATEVTANDPSIGDGYYWFSAVQPGLYYIKFYAPDDHLFSAANQGGNDTSDSDVTSLIEEGTTNIFGLNSGENDRDTDAGLYKPSSIGDFVWNDFNENGIQDTGEPGIPDVEVRLRRSTGQTLQTTTTDQNGRYVFNGLTQGVYFVTFEAPEEFQFSPKDQGTDDRDSDADDMGNTALVSLAHDFDFVNMDAGLFRAQSLIGQRVWLDFNRNGIREDVEEPMANVMVNLLDPNGNVVQSIPTSVDGEYVFASVPTGNYYVMFEEPEGYIFTTKDAGTDDTQDSDVSLNGMSEAIHINGNFLMHLDAGLYPDEGLRGTIFNDTNLDNIKDITEVGLSEITISLFDKDDKLIQAVSPDQNGFYMFKYTPEGMYYVRIVSEDKKVATALSLVDQAWESDLFQFDFTEDHISKNFGFYTGGEVSSLVWMDDNRDGSKSEMESGKADISVELVNESGHTIDQTISDDQGMVYFRHIPVGQYFLKYNIDQHLKFAAPDMSDEMHDSDVYNLYGLGTTMMFEVMPEILVNDISAGLISQDNMVEISLYPNPARSQSKAKIILSKDNLVSYQVHASDGQKVISNQADQKLLEGTNFLDLDFSSVSPGLYQIKFKIGKTSLTKQIVILD